MKLNSMRNNHSFKALFFSAAWLFAPHLLAHNVWLAPDAQGGYLMQFGGHAGKLEPFVSSKLQRVQAYDQRGYKLDATVKAAPGGLRVLPPVGTTLIAVEYDNGHFSGEPGAMKPLAMDQNPGATRGIHALKFHKTIIAWNALTSRAIGQGFELIPQSHSAPHQGEPLKILVHLHGKPFEGARVSLGEHGTPSISNAKGMATIQTGAGLNHVQAIHRQPIQGDPKITERSYEALLSFETH